MGVTMRSDLCAICQNFGGALSAKSRAISENAIARPVSQAQLD
jgi:hypothetical protein